MPRLRGEIILQNTDQRKLTKRLRKEYPDMKWDESIISKLAKYRYLPTPPMLDALCAVLDVDKLDLYTREELDLLREGNLAAKVFANAQEPRKSGKGTGIVKPTFRVPESLFYNFRAKLADDKRFTNMTAWIVRQMIDYLSKEETTPDAGTTDAA